MKYNRAELSEILQFSEATVKFTKKNGEERTMRCTLQEGVIPPASKEDPLSQKKIRSINEEVLPVWDTENSGWRSFRIDSVIEVIVS